MLKALKKILRSEAKILAMLSSNWHKLHSCASFSMASSGATQKETSLQPAVLGPHSPKPKSGLLAFLLLEHDALNCFASDLPCASGLHCSGARDDNDFDDFRSLEAWNAFKLFKALK